MTYGTVNVDSVVNSDGVTSGGLYGFKNRIINGAMVIDQRNAGASVTQTASTVYTVDRWGIFGSVTSKFTAEQTITGVAAPAGFSDYLGITSSASTSVGASDIYDLFQFIEGFNTADLGWGTASASSVTLSFWVRSSLTGTFGGAVSNSAYSYSYPFSYTISAANTWEQKTITIAGPTAGTWIGATNGIGLRLYFGLGIGSTNSGTAGSWSANGYASVTGATSVVGTSGATFYITGVQLEKGSTATSFDYRPYGTELALCQRYYTKFIAGTVGASTFGVGAVNGTTGAARVGATLPVPMRSSPTFGYSSCRLYDGNTPAPVTSINANQCSPTNMCVDLVASTWSSVAGRSGVLIENLASGYVDLTAEL